MLTIQPTGGLCNYLRVIFSYYEYAKTINSELNVIWLITPACNGNFIDYFEPIPNMNIMFTVPENVDIYYKGYDRHPDFKHNYNNLKLLPYMKEIIKTRINALENNYISVHIRRTDHIKLAKENNRYIDDDDFINFIDKFEKNVYIATDNEKTYNTFKRKYPSLVKLDYHETNSNALRHTSLRDAIIDIYMCAFSSNFMGSGWSSFSQVIDNLRKNKEMIEI